MLVHGLLDFKFVFLSLLQVYIRSPFNLKIVVDSALQVIDVYQSTINLSLGDKVSSTDTRVRS